MKKRLKFSLSDKHNLKGLIFLIPFYLGVVFFYARPIIDSISFSFNDVKVSLSGFDQSFIAFKNFDYIFTEDESFTTILFSDFLNLLWKTPVIVILSLFFALLINQKFKGRTFVRAVFFLPVIFSSGVVLDVIQGDLVVSSMLNSTSLLDSGGVQQTMGLQELLLQAGIQDDVVAFLTQITNSFFALIWNSGIQMLIFLSGLQSISGSLYEAASVEGATAWQTFCKITIPLLSPMIFLNIIYTIVDSYTSTSNGVISLILTNITNNRFGYGSAMAWVYFLFIGIILAIVFVVYSKLTNSKSKV